MALASVGAQLARWGYRVLAVDMDLEAPGLDRFFAPWLEQAVVGGGMLELIRGFGRPDARPWRSYVQTVRLPKSEGKLPAALDFLGAGYQDDRYESRVQQLNWDALYREGIGRFLETLRAEWITTYDLVLIDSRTGVSDTGGVCTIQMPDILVVLFTPNDQSVGGVARVAARAQEAQAELPLDRGRLLVVPVTTRVDQTEFKLRTHWEARIQKRLGHFVSAWAGSESLVPKLLAHLSVPYVPYWSYGERVPSVDESSSESRQGVRFAHETLAALLVNELSDVVDLVSNRDAFVRQAQTGGAVQSRVDVYLSYPRSDAARARQMSQAMRREGLSVWLDDRVLPAEDWETTLAKAVHDARSFVFLAGPHRSEWQDFEVREATRAALTGDKPIIPVLLAGAQPEHLPSLLRQFTVIRSPGALAVINALKRTLGYEIRRKSVSTRVRRERSTKSTARRSTTPAPGKVAKGARSGGLTTREVSRRSPAKKTIRKKSAKKK